MNTHSAKQLKLGHIIERGEDDAPYIVTNFVGTNDPKEYAVVVTPHGRDFYKNYANRKEECLPLEESRAGLRVAGFIDLNRYKKPRMQP